MTNNVKGLECTTTRHCQIDKWFGYRRGESVRPSDTEGQRQRDSPLKMGHLLLILIPWGEESDRKFLRMNTRNIEKGKMV